MSPERFMELTGDDSLDNINSSQINYIIKRKVNILENLLGYTLDFNKSSENNYNELGKSSNDCIFPFNSDSLEAPDDITGSYRLYKYNDINKLYLVDPFTDLYNIKLVHIGIGNVNDGYTVKTFNSNEISVVSDTGFAKWLSKGEKRFRIPTCSCNSPRMFAVEALWLNEETIPIELEYLIIDLVNDELNGVNNSVKSESVTSHSVTYKDTEDIGETGLYLNNYQLNIVKKYAGPFGLVTDKRYI